MRIEGFFGELFEGSAGVSPQPSTVQLSRGSSRAVALSPLRKTLSYPTVGIFHWIRVRRGQRGVAAPPRRLRPRILRLSTLRSGRRLGQRLQQLLASEHRVHRDGVVVLLAVFPLALRGCW